MGRTFGRTGTTRQENRKPRYVHYGYSDQGESRRVDFGSITTLYFVDEEPLSLQLIPLVPGHGINEVVYSENDPRQLPPNIILWFAPVNSTPTSISFPVHPNVGGMRYAWLDEQFKLRLIALLGQPLFEAIGLKNEVGLELSDVCLLRWRAISSITLGDYCHRTVNAALGLDTGWLGSRYL